MGQSVISKYILEAEDQTRSVLQSAAENFKDVTEKMIGYGSLASLASIAGFAALTHAQMETIDSTAKVADALGATTKGLSELDYAANTNGSSTQALNASLEVMEQKLGQARAGSQKAATEFERLGLDINQLAQQRPEVTFAQVSDAISKLGTGADRAAAAQAIFGKEYREIMPVLMLGADGLKRSAQEADALGVSFNRIDAAKVEAANDAIAKMNEATKGLANDVAIKLSPIIVALVNEFEVWAAKAGGTQKVVSEGMEYLVKVVGFLADMVRGLEVVWKIVEVAFQGFFTAALKGVVLLTEGFDGFVNLAISGANLVIEAINKIDPKAKIAEFQKLGGPGSFLDNMRASADDSTAALLKSEDELKKLANEPMPSDKVTKFFKDAAAAADAAANKVAAAKQKFSPTGGDADLYAEYLQQYTQEAMKEYQVTLTYLQKGAAAENNHYAEMRANLNKALQTNLIDQKTHDAQMEQLEKKHQAALVTAAKNGEMERAEFVTASWQSQVQIVTDSLLTMTQGVADSNKTMFEINKVAAISNAIINTALGVTKALSMYPPPISFVMAALQLVAGLAQVAAIESQSFGGGGSPGSVDSGSAATASDAANQTNNATQGGTVPGAQQYQAGDPTYSGGRAGGGTSQVIIQSTNHFHPGSVTEGSVPAIKKVLDQHQKTTLNKVQQMLDRRQMGRGRK